MERGARTLSSVVASQIATHAKYGGVVPELASREHLRAIVPVVRAALAEAGVTLGDLDAIAVTSGPGLGGRSAGGDHLCESAGVCAGPAADRGQSSGRAHSCGALNGKGWQGNIRGSPSVPPSARTLGMTSQRRSLRMTAKGRILMWAALALVVSGGHTHLYLAQPLNGTWRYTLVGRTLDDAAGEAYDKVAKLLGLGYPGGPWIDALARFGDPRAVPFSFRADQDKGSPAGRCATNERREDGADRRARSRIFCFRFRGSRRRCCATWSCITCARKPRRDARRLFTGPDAPDTADDRRGSGDLRSHDARLDRKLSARGGGRSDEEDFCRSRRPWTLRRILVTGGVAANGELRERFTAEAARRGIGVAFPTLALSTDNAAMIAAAAWPRYVAGEFAPADLTADPSLVLGR